MKASAGRNEVSAEEPRMVSDLETGSGSLAPLAVQREIARALGREDAELQDSLVRVLEVIVRARYATGAALSLFDEWKPEMRPIVHWGLSPQEVRRIERLVEGETLASSLRVLDSPRFVEGGPEWAGGKGLRSLIAVPVRAWGRGLGVLWLVTERSGESVRFDFDLFDIIGWQIGLALQNAHLNQRTERQMREWDVLFEVSRAITATLDVDVLLRLIVDSAVKTIPAAEAGVIHLLDRKDGYLRPRALSFLPHIPRDTVGKSKMKKGQGVAGQALETGLVVNVADTRSDPRFVRAETGREFRSLLVAPLIVEGEGIGTLSVDSEMPGAFSPADEKLINLLALQAAIAIQNAQLFADLKQTQAQLIQSEKLSALGKLIAGVAHELNNPLTAVMGYAQLLQGSRGLTPEIRRDLDKIYAQAQRAARIVEHLLTFARQHKVERVLVNINDVLEKTLEFRAYQLVVNNIQLKMDLDERDLLVLADPNQLQQVFLNLINNAQEAMVDYRGRGSLAVTTRLVGDVVRIEFTDDGPGIAPEAMSRLFDPFFTTKEVGKGTGLGLSICYGIITQHGGRIWAENSPLGGASFIIELPVAEGEMPPQEEKESEVSPPSRSSGRILIVDDEREIIEVLRRVFNEDGYQVDVVTDARAALQGITRAREMGQAYDLIVTDIKMPGLNGRELYEELKRTEPDLARRVVFFTGDMVSDETIAFLEGTGNRYVAKPLGVDALRRAAREILETDGD